MKPRWIMVERPARYADILVLHLPLAAISGGLLLASAFWHVLPIPVSFCVFRELSGRPCPFCGGSRTFESMAHGEWSAAFVNSPLAALLFVLVVLIFLWNAAALIAGLRIAPGPGFREAIGPGKHLLIAATILVLANWLYRLMMGFD